MAVQPPELVPGTERVTADLVIVGGGQSGLAAAYAAQRAGLGAVVLEAGAEPGGSWPQYYDSLTLFSPARFSALPGRPFPGDGQRYPTRDQIAADLAPVARVSLATRTPLRFKPQRLLGRDLHWWLARSGLDAASIGRWLDRRTSVVDDGHYRAALRSGNPDPRPMFTELDGD